MPFTKLLKPVVAKAHKTILIADDHPLDQAQFDLLDDLIKSLAWVIERRAKIFHPMINFDDMLLTVSSKRFLLKSKLLLLPRRRHTRIHNHQPLLRGNQPAIGQIEFVRVVAAIRRATECRQDAFAIPFLQGIDRFPNQLAKLFWGICMLHAYILLYHHSFFNTVEDSFGHVPAVWWYPLQSRGPGRKDRRHERWPAGLGQSSNLLQRDGTLRNRVVDRADLLPGITCPECKCLNSVSGFYSISNIVDKTRHVMMRENKESKRDEALPNEVRPAAAKVVHQTHHDPAPHTRLPQADGDP